MSRRTRRRRAAPVSYRAAAGSEEEERDEAFVKSESEAEDELFFATKKARKALVVGPKKSLAESPMSEEEEEEALPMMKRGQAGDEDDDYVGGDEEEEEEEEQVPAKKPRRSAKRRAPVRRGAAADDDFIVPDDEVEGESGGTGEDSEASEASKGSGSDASSSGGTRSASRSKRKRKGKAPAAKKRRQSIKKVAGALAGDSDSDEAVSGADTPQKSGVFSPARRSSTPKRKKRASGEKFSVGRGRRSDDEFGSDGIDAFIVADDEVEMMDESDAESGSGDEAGSSQEEASGDDSALKVAQRRRRSVIDDDDDASEEKNVQTESDEEDDMVIHQVRRPKSARKVSEHFCGGGSRTRNTHGGHRTKARGKAKAKKRKSRGIDEDEQMSHMALLRQFRERDEVAQERAAAVAPIKLRAAFSQYLHLLGTAALGGADALDRLRQNDAASQASLLKGCSTKVEDQICTYRESCLASGAWGAKREDALRQVKTLPHLSTRPLDAEEREAHETYECDLCGRRAARRGRAGNLEYMSGGVSWEAVLKGWPYQAQAMWEARHWTDWTDMLHPAAGVLPEHADAWAAGKEKQKRRFDEGSAGRHIVSYMVPRGDGTAASQVPASCRRRRPAASEPKPRAKGLSRGPRIELTDDSEEDDEDVVEVVPSHTGAAAAAAADDPADADGSDVESEADEKARLVDDSSSDGADEDGLEPHREVTFYLGSSCKDRLWQYHNLLHYKFRVLRRIKAYAASSGIRDADELIADKAYLKDEWHRLMKYLGKAGSHAGRLVESDPEDGDTNMRTFLTRNRERRDDSDADVFHDPDDDDGGAADDGLRMGDSDDSGDGPLEGGPADADPDFGAVDEDEDEYDARLVRDAGDANTPAPANLQTPRAAPAGTFSTGNLKPRRGFKLSSRASGRFKDPLAGGASPPAPTVPTSSDSKSTAHRLGSVRATRMAQGTTPGRRPGTGRSVLAMLQRSTSRNGEAGGSERAAATGAGDVEVVEVNSASDE